MTLPVFIMIIDSLMVGDTLKVDSTVINQCNEIRMQQTIVREKIDSLIYKLQNDAKLKEKVKQLKARRKK